MNQVIGDFDPYLTHLSPDGELLAENDGGSGELNARIYYVLPDDRSYVIAASGLGDSSGEYELSLVVEK